MSIATNWGTTLEERQLAFPCDRLTGQPQSSLYRGITIQARPPTVYRWLCQLRRGSYSYTSTSRSPRQLTDGLDELEIGQTFMGVFGLVEFEPDKQLTLRLEFESSEGRAYGRFVKELLASYVIVPRGDACRLLLKYALRYRDGPFGLLARAFLPWGDLVMARKQLMNLRDLAENA